MAETKRYSVTRLEVENYVGVECVALELENGITVLRGKMGSGKTSILSALKSCLGGRAVEPEDPIREGHASARVLTILSSEGVPQFVIEKTFRRGKESTLVLKAADESPLPKGATQQALLNSFLSSFTLNLRDFLDPPGEKTVEGVGRAQKVMLLKAFPCGVDLDALAAKQKKAREDRTESNRDAKSLEGALGPMVAADETVPDAVDLLALEERLRADRIHNASIERATTNLADHWHRVNAATLAVEKLREDLVDAELALQTRKDEHEALEKARSSMKPRDVAALETEVREGQTKNQDRAGTLARNQSKEEARKRRAATKAKIDAAQKKSDELTKVIEDCDAQREAAILAANFPVPGLGIDEAGVTFRGHPFSQASGGERLETALNVAAAAARGLTTIMVDEADAFDDDAMSRIDQFARERGFQVLMTGIRLTGPGVNVVLKDGQVAAEPTS